MVRLAPEPSRPALRARLDGLLDRTSDEREAVLSALEGRYVPAGPSGSPSRGMWNVLPTGRNFYSVDPQAIPSPPAWETGAPPGGRPHRALLPGARTPPPHRRPRHLGHRGDAHPRRRRRSGPGAARRAPPLAPGDRARQRGGGGAPGGPGAPPGRRHGAPRRLLQGRLPAPGRPPRPGRALVARWMGSRRPDNPVAAHVRRDRPHLGAHASARLFGSKPGCYGAGLLP